MASFVPTGAHTVNTKEGPLIEIELSSHFFQEAARIQKLYTIRNYSSNLHVLPQQTRSHCTLISQDKSYTIKNRRYSTVCGPWSGCKSH